MSPVIKGPWLQWPTTESVVVMWETTSATAGAVEWFEAEPVHAGLSGRARTLAATRQRAGDATAGTVHRVRRAGLEAGRDYH